MRRFQIAACVAMLFATPGLARAAGDGARGEQIYHACQDCHTLDENDVGPKHRGVFGRRAGSVPDYSYSTALKQSGIIWNETTLDAWLTGPTTFVPGSKMGFRLTDAQARADVIEYLKENAR